ncbi:MAG: glycine betaine/L-proline ABC transporter ATP-binding protein [Chloroflexota bacterium]|nr:glycine betaine/L-proline ABC transporter ATP-binding protein [Chloroflexota bacterium]MDE2921097.1 glycine betaine/L-proline ABC transporter ATP-binding protein [Chloroflexota bacterium]
MSDGTANVAQGARQVDVHGLWKVFGNKPERALEAAYGSKSRSEIQDELGLVVALRDVSFSVDQGQIFVVMGLSGSGKSTLVRALIRLVEPTRGSISIDGEDVLSYTTSQLMEFRRQKIAMVFQNYGLLPHRSVMDNVALGLEIRGIDKETRYQMSMESIETVGLGGWEDYRPREMSGGMQQRVGLARALAVNPDMLLMDEPFSGLDPLIRRELQDELISLQTKLKKTIVFITHDLNEALKVGDRIAVMRDGEIIQEGSPEEIVTLPSDEYVTEFVQDVSRAKVIQARAVMQESDVVVYERQGPRAALHIMDSHRQEAVFLIGRDFTLRGVLTKDRVMALIDERRRSLEGAEVDPATTTTPDALIEDIIPIAAQTRHPIAVVDDTRALLGEIRPGALLAGMAEGEQGT